MATSKNFLQVITCAKCNEVIDITYKCKCIGGRPRVWKKSIPIEWEEYFFMDGSVKVDPILVEVAKVFSLKFVHQLKQIV